MNELPSVSLMKVRKARNQHMCCECFGDIHPGEQYHYHSGIWDGSPADFKVCPECDELRNAIDEDAFPGEGTAFGFIAESIFDSDEFFKFAARYISIQAMRGAVINKRMLECMYEEIA